MSIKAVLFFVLATLTVAAATLTGCAKPTEVTWTASPEVEAPGTIVDAKPWNDVDDTIRQLGASSFKMTYRSTSAYDDSSTEVTGTAFVPAGEPPRGGWPVIAFAHGTTGINPGCNPSQSPTLFGSIGLVAGYLQLGYAVAATDYQGLGGPGAHPYVDNTTAGYNVIDSVRALRHLSPNVSARWGAFGGSQGGGAAWAANDQAHTYAPELDMVGAVSLAPIGDISALPQAIAERKATLDQMGLYIWALMGVERTHPGFDIGAYRHGLAKERWEALSGCNQQGDPERVRALFEMKPEDLVPSSPEAVKTLSEIFSKMAVAQRRADAPILVIFGGADTYVDYHWTRVALARACALGTRVASVFQPDKGHNNLDPSEFSGYLMARFDGLPAPSNC